MSLTVSLLGFTLINLENAFSAKQLAAGIVKIY